jgi:hypothetical protein
MILDYSLLIIPSKYFSSQIGAEIAIINSYYRPSLHLHLDFQNSFTLFDSFTGKTPILSNETVVFAYQ